MCTETPQGIICFGRKGHCAHVAISFQNESGTFNILIVHSILYHVITNILFYYNKKSFISDIYSWHAESKYRCKCIYDFHVNVNIGSWLLKYMYMYIWTITDVGAPSFPLDLTICSTDFQLSVSLFLWPSWKLLCPGTLQAQMPEDWHSLGTVLKQ